MSPQMERMMRIELTLSAWKAEVLPLNYIRVKPAEIAHYFVAAVSLACLRTRSTRASTRLRRALSCAISAMFLNWSGRRDSNSRPSPWQGDALPLSHFRIIGGGRWIRTIESSASGFTVRPLWPLGNPSVYGAGDRSRTNNLLITNQLLCH